MAIEQETKQTSNRELEDRGNRLAEICREIRDLRDEVSEIYAIEPADVREQKVASLFARILVLETEANSLFPEIQTEIKNIVGSCGLVGREFDESVLEAETKIRLNLHKFFTLVEPETPVGSRFRGWLKTVVRRSIIDRLRVTSHGAATTLNLRFKKELLEKYGESLVGQSFPASDPVDLLEHDRRRATYAGAPEFFRQIPEHFTEAEEQHIASLPKQCQVLFLFSTGLWNQLSTDKQTYWSDAQASHFELNHLSAVARANRFVLKMVEDELAGSSINWDINHEALIEDLTTKKANVVAQNLNRHFWRFMQLDTAWQYLFVCMEPLDSELTAAIEECLDSDLMLAYLQCDVYMRCDTATRCFTWLDECGFENSIPRNLGRVAGQKAIVYDSKSGARRRANEKKWEYACRFAGREAKSISAEQYVKSVFSQRVGPQGRTLPLSVAAKRMHVDLPLAFERTSETELKGEIAGVGND